MTITSSLSLNKLHLPVFLGVYPQEQLQKCSISIDLHLGFLTPPQGCQTDELEDTYCYDHIIAYLKDKLGERKFKLIEYLSREIHGLLKDFFPAGTQVSVRLTKLPNIPELTQGATFEYGDEKVAWSF